MTSKDNELVLCVPTAVFHEAGYFCGVNCYPLHYLRKFFLNDDRGPTEYKRRGDVEDDPNFKQLIPYVVPYHYHDDDKISLFQYVRGKAGGEDRLHAKRSVGIGGHVNPPLLMLDHWNSFLASIHREIAEEVRIDGAYGLDIAGMVNYDGDAVGKVHLGVIILLSVEEPAIYPREENLKYAYFRRIEDLRADKDRLETWSQQVVENFDDLLK